jgi:hypothetical protein
LDRLDIYETYLPTSKQPIEIISSAYGVYDGLPIRFALAQDGTLYTYEQLFKGQDFSVRLSQVLNFENVALVVPQGDKRIVLLVERDTGVVNTLYVDYNAERDVRLLPKVRLLLGSLCTTWLISRQILTGPLKTWIKKSSHGCCTKT